MANKVKIPKIDADAYWKASDDERADMIASQRAAIDTPNIDIEALKTAYCRAGGWLKEQISRQDLSISNWSRAHGFGLNTILTMTRGAYNLPNGPSMLLVKEISLALAENDARRARLLAREFLSLAGIIPDDREAGLLREIIEIEGHLKEIKAKVSHWK